MPSNKPRMTATLPTELHRGRMELRRTGISDTSLIHQGIVALAYVDDARLKQIQTWTTLLSDGMLTWGEFLERLRESEAAQQRSVKKLLEEHTQRKLKEAREQQSRREKGRVVQAQ
jgi:hypothetical protein